MSAVNYSGIRITIGFEPERDLDQSLFTPYSFRNPVSIRLPV